MGRRRGIGKTEGRRCDRLTSERLRALDVNPARTVDRVLVDLQHQRGRVFRGASLREKWLFHSTARSRAAEFVLSFEKWASDGADLRDLRHVVLRPLGHKIDPVDLDVAMRELSDRYDTHVGKLVSAGMVQPIASVVQFGYCLATGQIDLHLHAIWRVAPKHMDDVQRGIQTKFSTTWMSTERIRKPGALMNYVCSGVVDHRSLCSWSDAAFLAVWNLKKPKLLRAAGELQAFRRSLKGFRLIRRAGEILAVPIKARAPRGTEAPTRERKHGSTLGYVAVTLDGLERLCAIVAVKAGGRLTNRQVSDVLSRSWFASSGRRYYPTAETGSSPPAPASPPSAAPPTAEVSATSASPRDNEQACSTPPAGHRNRHNLDPQITTTAPTTEAKTLRNPLKIAVSGFRRLWSALSRAVFRVVRRNE